MMSNIAVKIKWFAAIGIPVFIQLIPINDVFTEPMRAFLVATTFVILLAAFELLPVLLVGLLLPTMYIILGAAPANVALGVWSGSLMIFTVIGGFAFANALDESGLLNRMVLWAGGKCKGSFSKILFVLLAIGIVIMFITFGGAWLITLVLCYGLVKALHLQNTKEGILIMLVGQLISTSSLGYLYVPANAALYQSGINMVLPDYIVELWMPTLFGLPKLVIDFIILFLFIKLYKPVKKLNGGEEYFTTEYAKLGPVSIKEKKAAAILILMLLYLFTQPLHKLDINYGFIIIPALFFLPGIDVATKKSLDHINIGFIVFIASCMGIGTVGGSVGIGAAISTYITPFLQGCPKPIFLLGCLIFGVIMNILMTPMAMVGMFPGPLTGIAAGLGIANPLIPTLAMFYANDLVFFPYENGYLVVLFGFGVMKMKDFMKYNVIKIGMFLILFCLLVLPWWYLLGLV